MTGSFLEEPPVSTQARALYDEDLADSGYVWNVSRLWAHQPDTLKRLFGLMACSYLSTPGHAVRPYHLPRREAAETARRAP